MKRRLWLLLKRAFWSWYQLFERCVACYFFVFFRRWVLCLRLKLIIFYLYWILKILCRCLTKKRCSLRLSWSKVCSLRCLLPHLSRFAFIIVSRTWKWIWYIRLRTYSRRVMAGTTAWQSWNWTSLTIIHVIALKRWIYRLVQQISITRYCLKKMLMSLIMLLVSRVVIILWIAKIHNLVNR